MKERPILFNADMVRAILEGRKTQTRRPVKNLDLIQSVVDGVPMLQDGHGDWVETALACPFGQPGDRLWVRETWANYQVIHHRVRQDGASWSEASDGSAAYRADGFDSIEDLRKHIKVMGGHDIENVYIDGGRWRPSIHMPRWASRITLEIVNVRVELLYDMPDADFYAEGFVAGEADTMWEGHSMAKGAFFEAWESIYGKTGDDIWVWVVEFKVVQS